MKRIVVCRPPSFRKQKALPFTEKRKTMISKICGFLLMILGIQVNFVLISKKKIFFFASYQFGFQLTEAGYEKYEKEFYQNLQKSKQFIAANITGSVDKNHCYGNFTYKLATDLKNVYDKKVKEEAVLVDFDDIFNVFSTCIKNAKGKYNIEAKKKKGTLDEYSLIALKDFNQESSILFRNEINAILNSKGRIFKKSKTF